MALFRSFSEIVNSMIQRLSLVQPNLDTKPGSVSRDLFVDIQADQLEKIYRAISVVSGKQSLASAIGRDLDQLARNFSIVRRGGTPSGGIVVFTTPNLLADISIPSGSIVSSRNGANFNVVGNYVMSSSEKSKYAANANRLRGSLNLAGIDDSYAIEVAVQSSGVGKSGNISNFQITSSAVSDSLKVTNISSFSGGSNVESDESFRARILGIFNGSNTGTSAGYKNAVLGVTGVIDAMVVEPGNTLMLRDGSETIEVNGGDFRILNSGTGGKVDVYALGRLLQVFSDSFIYTDLSGSGDASDERNDYIIGQRGIDETLTSEERRLYALKNNVIPYQPISSIVSVAGSNSGVFSEETTDDSGNVFGNYELILDENPETGGSPFGFDKIRWTSSTKNVESEVFIKGSSNSIEPFSFYDIINVNDVYIDVKISSENSHVSSADRSVVNLMHKPAKTVSRVKNETTSEVYSIVSQNKSDSTGLNDEGTVTVSGRSLPTTSDVLSVDYVWRHSFDEFIDYNGTNSRNYYLRDFAPLDAIDWGVSNEIIGEESVLEKTDDDLSYLLELNHGIDRVNSVYSKEVADLEVITAKIGDVSFNAVEIPSSSDEVDNVVSVKNSYGVEGYNTRKSDGTFSSRTIYFPTDSIIENGETVEVSYNKVELFDIVSTDGSFYNNSIVMPSEDVLDESDVLDVVSDLYSSEGAIYADYVRKSEYILPPQDFSVLPIRGIFSSEGLVDASLTNIDGSLQPVTFYYLDSETTSGVEIFAPTNLVVSVSNSTRSGKVKVSGTTMSRLEVDIYAGLSVEDLTFNLSSEIESFMVGCEEGLVGVARVDYVAKLDADDKPSEEYDILGYAVENSYYDYGVGLSSEDLTNKKFTLPSTPNNLSISLTSGDKVRVSLLVYNEGGVEDFYFPGDGIVISDSRFSRIDLVSVTSGFRNSAGTLAGTVSIGPFNQPSSNERYNSDYDFTAPKEGERITISYNTNTVLASATAAVELVRSITADVLVKGAEELVVDVYGTIVINDESLNNSNIIVENAANAVTNVLTSGALGDVIDFSDIISAVAATDGVDSVDVHLFNESGETGRKSFVKALNNQTIVAGTISFEAVSRQNFRVT